MPPTKKEQFVFEMEKLFDQAVSLGIEPNLLESFILNQLIEWPTENGWSQIEILLNQAGFLIYERTPLPNGYHLVAHPMKNPSFLNSKNLQIELTLQTKPWSGKITTIDKLSNSCVITYGGNESHLHEGLWVKWLKNCLNSSISCWNASQERKTDMRKG